MGLEELRTRMVTYTKGTGFRIKPKALGFTYMFLVLDTMGNGYRISNMGMEKNTGRTDRFTSVVMLKVSRKGRAS